MKTKLIIALKKTVDDLVNNKKEYQWTDIARCNCGIVAQNVCGFSERQVDHYAKSLWTDMAEECQSTGIPINIIMAKLQEVGMSWEDIMDLEYCGNEKICEEAGISIRHMKGGRFYATSNGKALLLYQTKEGLIRYLNAWIRILEREQPTPIKFIKLSEMVENQIIHFEN